MWIDADNCVLERGVLGVLFGTWQWEMGFPPEQLCCTDGTLVKLMYEYN
jgi:hypothetical protein